MGAGWGAHVGAGAVTAAVRRAVAWKVPFLVFALSALFLASSGDARAQEFDLFEDEACREDPSGEDCICAKVRQLGHYPINSEWDVDVGYVVGLDSDGDGVVPEFDPERGIWSGNPATPASVDADAPDGDLIFSRNDFYHQQCALSYFREDLRRMWRFGVALGAALAAASVAWAGVVWMQESASGNDIARSRGMIIRVVIGVIILSCSYLVWEGVSSMLSGHLETWSGERGSFYRPWGS